ncbi:MAG: CvpA family protein [Anaerolineae bacterium]|nr:CvpA family protein [Anaerolineae bacterium]
MNFLDVLLTIALIAGGAMGLFQGLIKQVVGLGSLYFSLVVSTIAYRLVGRWLTSAFGYERAASDALSFMVILIVLYMGLILAVLDLLKNSKQVLPGTLDRLGGMVIGFLNVSIWVAIALSLLNSTVSFPWYGYEGVRQGIANQIRTSALRPVFSYLLPTLLITVRPFLPGGLPPLFTNLIF